MADIEESNPLQQVIESLKGVNVSLDEIKETIDRKKQSYSAREIPATSVKDTVPPPASSGNQSAEQAPAQVMSQEPPALNEEPKLNVLSEDALKTSNSKDTAAETDHNTLPLQPADNTFNADQLQPVATGSLVQDIQKIFSNSLEKTPVAKSPEVLSENNSVGMVNSIIPEERSTTREPSPVSKIVDTVTNQPIPSSTPSNKSPAKPELQSVDAVPATKDVFPVSIQAEPPVAVGTENTLNHQNETITTGSLAPDNASVQPVQQIQNNIIVTQSKDDGRKKLPSMPVVASNTANVVPENKELPPVPDITSSLGNLNTSEPIAPAQNTPSLNSNIPEITDSTPAVRSVPPAMPDIAAPAAAPTTSENKIFSENEETTKKPALEIVEEPTKGVIKDNTKDNSMIMVEKNITALNSTMTKNFSMLLTQVTNLNNTVSEILKIIPELKPGPGTPAQAGQGQRETRPFTSGGGSINEFRSATTKMFAPGRADINPTI